MHDQIFAALLELRMLLLLIAPIAAFSGVRWPWLAALVALTVVGSNVWLYSTGGEVRARDVAILVPMLVALTAAAAGARRLFRRG